MLLPPLERIASDLLQRRLNQKQVGLSMALLSELIIIYQWRAVMGRNSAVIKRYLYPKQI